MTVPGEKIALFIDGANLYATAKSLGFDIDYKRLLREFQSRGYLLRAFYYTAVIEDQEYSSIRPLIDWLDYNGYSVVTKATKEFVDQTGRRKVKGNMDIELAVDAMEIAGTIDHMVLFSGDGDFRSLVEAVQRKGVRVTVVSTSPPSRRWSPTSCAARPTSSSTSSTLQTKIGRDPAERAARDAARPPREDHGSPQHTPQFLQRPPTTPQRAGAPVGADDDDELFRITTRYGDVDGKPGRDCPRCPRLVAFRKTWRTKEPTWFNAPVPSFGPLDARVLIVGLAPGAARRQPDRPPIHRRLCRRAALRDARQIWLCAR